jgi:hypothetical protein
MNVGNFLIEGPGGVFQILANQGYRSNLPVIAPIQDAGGQSFDVKAYGAKGDGVTDDTAAINRTIAALPSGGGKVYFPRGAYLITSTITIFAHGVWLIGEAFSETFADQGGEQPGLTGISRLVASPGFSTTAPMVQFGLLGANQIWTDGGTDNLLMVNANGTTGDGVDILNMQHVRIINSGFNGFSRGAYVASDVAGGISNVYIDHNMMWNLKGTAVYLDGGSDENYVRHNYIAGASGRAIFVNGIGNTIFQNHIESTTQGSSGLYRKGTGIYVAGQDSFIIGNDFLTTDRDGIYCSASDTTIIGNTVRNPNNSSFSDGSGIFVEGGITGVLVDANNLLGPNNKMAYGIYDASSTAGGVTIGINHVKGAQTADLHSVNNALKPVAFLSTMGFGTSNPAADRGISVQAPAGTTNIMQMRDSSGNDRYHTTLYGAGHDFGYVETGVLDGRIYIQSTANGGAAGVNTTTPTASWDVSASTAGRASLRIRSGTAPTSPNDGDIWYDGANLKIRVGGTTKTFTIT